MNCLAPCIPLLLSNNLDHSGALEDLIKFSTISLEYLRFLLTHRENFPVSEAEVLLSSADATLRQDSVAKLLDKNENLIWFCSSANSIFHLVEALLKSDKPLPSIPNYFPRQFEDEVVAEHNESSEAIEKISSETTVSDETTTQAVHLLYILVCWFHDLKCLNRTKIPDFLFKSIKRITISLSRLSVANSYVLVPLKAWKSGWTPEIMSGTFKTQVLALPIEILQDVEVLEEYIFRFVFTNVDFQN